MIREPSFFILSALVRTPLHGYAILKPVALLSKGRINLRAGTLYAALDRLSREGLLSSDGEEIVSGRLRRLYRITDAGLATLRDGADLFAANASIARQLLARIPGT